MKRSEQQQAIVDWSVAALSSNTRASAIVNAVAGSGKSTTAVEVMGEALTNWPQLAGDICYLAFGKRNQRDMVRKLAKHNIPLSAVNVQTFNAAGLSQLIYRGRKCSLNFRRSQDILEDLGVAKNWQWALAELWIKLQEAAAGVMDEAGKVWWPSLQELETIAVNFDIDCKFPVRKKTRDTWAKVDGWMKDLAKTHAKLEGVVTFSDQVWLPVKRASGEIPMEMMKTYRLLIVDEFQDLNVIRRIFANQSTREDSVTLYLGDRAQAIFGFSGADTNAFQSVIDSQPCKVNFLPLTYTFRCPPAVVKDAQNEVKEIECAPWLNVCCGDCGTCLEINDNRSCYCGNKNWMRPDGINEIRPLAKCDFKPGDVILCRNNRPLVDMFFKLLDRRIPVRFEGGEWAQKILSMHRAFIRREDPQTLTQYRSGVHDECERRVKELLNHEPPRKWKAAQVRDEYAAWLSLITYVMTIPQAVLDIALSVPDNPFGEPQSHVTRGVDTVRQFLDAIEKNANNDDDEVREAMVTLSTGHKAKGLEWDNVYWYGFDELHPSKLATTAEELEQERNLVYVIKTRARRALYKVPLKESGSRGAIWGDEIPDNAGVMEDEEVGV